MRSCLVVGLCAALGGVAHANGMGSVGGWTAGGELTLMFPAFTYDPTSEAVRCAPVALGGELACEPCDLQADRVPDASERATRKKACAVKTKAGGAQKAAKNKAISVVFKPKVKCKPDSDCSTEVVLLRTGEKKPTPDSPRISFTASEPNATQLAVWTSFRPDSRALAVTIDEFYGEYDQHTHFWVVDLAQFDTVVETPVAPASGGKVAAGGGVGMLAYSARGGWFPVKVVSKSGGKAKVTALDKDTWEVAEKSLRPNPRVVIGDRVVAIWQANNLWYKGNIQEITDGKAFVVFDDGDTGWIPLEGVVLESANTAAQ